MASLTTLLDSEASLIQEAALALPYSFERCTHSMGPLRQPVHLCLTCAIPRGLCSACSVACHGDHEQVELFPKRAFVCDCPTAVGDKACTLQREIVADNSNNVYGQNFHGKFCRCGRAYDAKRERETMVQCLICEDWFHESCLNLRTRPTERPSREPSNGPADEGAEVDSNASNDLPPPLLSSLDYDTLICGKCVLSNDTLHRWAGTEGIMMVVKNSETNVASQNKDGGIAPGWKVLDCPEDEAGKRPLPNDVDDEERPAKRLCTNHEVDVSSYEAGETSITILPPCLAPPLNPYAQRTLDVVRNRMTKSADTNLEEYLGHGDIFLKEGWRNRWCRCSKCLSALEALPYLLEEEETYEPPDDPDSAMSLEELGMRALQKMPRDRAIDGILAYNAMRDELMTYLRPFAEEGRVVQEEDVREFFEKKAQQRESIQ